MRGHKSPADADGISDFIGDTGLAIIRNPNGIYDQRIDQAWNNFIKREQDKKRHHGVDDRRKQVCPKPMDYTRCPHRRRHRFVKGLANEMGFSTGCHLSAPPTPRGG